LATSLVLFAVFLPVLFFPGATGTIYKQFAATILFAIAISTFNALSFSPMLSALLLSWDSGEPGRRSYGIAALVLRTLYGLLVSFSGGGTPLLVLLFAAIGAATGWFTPPIFRGFNGFYARAEQGYAGGLGWVLSHRRLVMAGLAGGIMLTAVAFNAIPSGFVPVEDQGYAIGIVQAPDGGSAENTRALNRKVAAILREEPSIKAGTVFSGASLDGNAPNRGLFFFGTTNWSERQGADQSMGAIVARLNRRFAALREGRVMAIEPPSIPGYGNSGGFEFQMLDRSGGSLGLPQFFGAANQLIQKANAEPGLERVFTQFSPEAPQLRITVDRARLASLGIDYARAMQVLSLNFGGAYVNDTFQEGKIRRVYVQADAPFRATPQRLEELYVPNAQGKPVPLAEFITIGPVTGPTVIPHFNLFRSIKVEGMAAPGFSSGQAISAMGQVFEKLGINGISYDWTGISREEVKAGSLAIVIFALGILVVYLVLAGQYESISDPLIILMTVPTAMLGALVFLSLRGEVLNIYAQVGLVMLIGLAAKNGILIVDLANQQMAEGLNALEAAREAARSRLRPIIMTAISSLFGFLPLVLASGAGARSQTSLGTVVFGGLLMATVLSLFVVPVFYVVMKTWLGERR
ncbi:MAG: efflux RND transporter permease subunit, partial [Synechococcaceae cyanobacterium]|nr:efflux RND transporter permease subunit [Synechococcaceae cyanobacterium]